MIKYKDLSGWLKFGMASAIAIGLFVVISFTAGLISGII